MSEPATPPPIDRSSPPRRQWLLYVPIAVMALLAGLFGYQLLHGRSDAVPSQVVGRAVPALTLPAATPDRPGIADAAGLATGEPRLINIFASWCVPCRAEAPSLEALAAKGVTIDGIAIRDTPADLKRFLIETGNPYRRIGADQTSDAMLSLGAAGVPETFIIDGKGRIHRQIQAPIVPADVPGLLAEIQALR